MNGAKSVFNNLTADGPCLKANSVQCCEESISARRREDHELYGSLRLFEIINDTCASAKVTSGKWGFEKLEGYVTALLQARATLSFSNVGS